MAITGPVIVLAGRRGWHQDRVSRPRARAGVRRPFRAGKGPACVPVSGRCSHCHDERVDELEDAWFALRTGIKIGVSLPHLAADALAAGFDSPALRELAASASVTISKRAACCPSRSPSWATASSRRQMRGVSCFPGRSRAPGSSPISWLGPSRP
ncbi:hypothetical protein FRAHR75_420030 [Frankia sp. Hr75.2]|nr:hypothetical protein FRAHR75_420030 [Frankia sp. Hr75.2]